MEQRERASDMDIFNDPYAVIDHIPYSHCAGEEGASFQEATHIPQRSRGSWAETFGSICAELGEASDPRNLAPLNKEQFEIRLERRVKFFYLIPFLILRKCPDKSNPSSINRLIRQRLSQWKKKE